MEEEEVPAVDAQEKGVSSDLIRGHINTIILRSLYDGDKYGYEIIAEIERKSHGQYMLKQPSLYSALKRLEKDGYITSYWGGSVSGGRRKYFSLSEEGKTIAEQNQAEWEYSRTIIDSLISDRDFDFSNPAPSVVNMRVLRSSTSRVPSREGEDEEEGEFVFDPAVDENSVREQLEQEYESRRAILESEYEERRNTLEEAYGERFALLEADKTNAETLKAEYEGKLAELKSAYDETLAQLKADYESEIEQIKGEHETEIEQLKGEQDALRAENEEKLRQSEALKEQIAELETAKETLAQEIAAQAARDSDEEREQLLVQIRMENEELLRTERENHERALRELQESGEASLRVEQEINAMHLREAQQAHEDALNAEREAHARALEEQKKQLEQAYAEKTDADVSLLQKRLEESERILRETSELNREELAKRDSIIEEERQTIEQLRAGAEANSEALRAEQERSAEALRTERENGAAALRERDEQIRARDARIANDKLHYDEQLSNERKRFEQALSEQEARLRADMQVQIAERERQLIHNNYINLVDAPQPPPAQEDFNHYTPSPNQNGDYRTTLERLYGNARGNSASVRETATPASGIDYVDIKKRAQRDGLRITTAGETDKPVPESLTENTVHRGKALFLSALVLAVYLVVLGIVCMGLQTSLAIPKFYPYIVWGTGIVILLATILAYANHFGEHSLRKPTIAHINCLGIFSLLVIITLIVCLSVMIDFSSPAATTAYIYLPIAFFFGVVVFGITYYLQVRPRKTK